MLQEIGNNAEPGAKTIIFVETKKKVETITRTIRKYGWPAVCMHGDKSQQERDYVLREFRNGKSSILVATDVAARGLGKFKYASIKLSERCIIIVSYRWRYDKEQVLVNVSGIVAFWDFPDWFWLKFFEENVKQWFCFSNYVIFFIYFHILSLHNNTLFATPNKYVFFYIIGILVSRISL